MSRRMLSLGLMVICLLFTVGCKPTVPIMTAWSYVPSNASIWGLTVDNTSDGGFIISGGHDGEYDMYTLKLSATGAGVWDKSYSNLTPDSNRTELWRHEARGARQTADGGYIVLGAGSFYRSNLPGFSYLLVKTDATGNIVWSNAYAPDNPYDEGHYTINNQPAALQVTSDGGYVAFGSSYVGQYDLASILKTDADGNVEFVKVINDNDRDYNEVITGGQQTQDGGYILQGYSDNGSPLGYLALLIKVDADGELEWSKSYQYPPLNYGVEGHCVTQTADGGYVIGGLMVNDIGKVSTHGFWMTKTDGNGNQIWANSYADLDSLSYANTVRETPEGDIVAGGSVHSGELAIAKFSSGGALLWTYSDETLPAATANDLVLTDDGGCVVVGSSINGSTVIMKVSGVYAPAEE